MVFFIVKVSLIWQNEVEIFFEYMKISKEIGGSK
jgi:hypothetical protein